MEWFRCWPRLYLPLVFENRFGYSPAGLERFPTKGVCMRPGLFGWLLLVGLFGGISLVWGLARWIKPYEADGMPKAMASHTQLGLPPCTFLAVTGIPCPSCGLTTSFSLMAHFDPVPAFRANPAGPILLMLSGILWIWSLVCIAHRRFYWSRKWEFRLVLWLGAVFLLLLLRWLAMVVVPRIFGN